MGNSILKTELVLLYVLEANIKDFKGLYRIPGGGCGTGIIAVRDKMRSFFRFGSDGGEDLKVDMRGILCSSRLSRAALPGQVGSRLSLLH